MIQSIAACVSDWLSRSSLSFLGLLSVAFWVGCSDSGESQRSEVFVFARGSDAQKLDPADMDDGESVNTISQICEGLVRLKSGTLEVEPCLAESYSISEDGMTYRFQLRANVVFHDGTPLNAETALFSFRRQMDPEHSGHPKEAWFSYWKYLYQDIEEVNAVGDMALEFRLSQPNASLLYSLAGFPAFLVSPNALETHGANFQRHPVGTGPFRFFEWRPNQVIMLERNDRYWGEKPSMHRIAITVTPDSTVRLLKLKTGEIHAMGGLQPAELAALKQDPKIQVFQETGLNVGYLAFNLENERMSNRALREAIALAIDRKTLAKVALKGASRSAHYPLPERLSRLFGARRADPLGRREGAGDRGGSPRVVWRTFGDPSDECSEALFSGSCYDCDFYQRQLEAVGIPVKVVSSDPN